VFDWTQLDNVINPIYNQEKDIWYTLVGCPTWAAKPANQGTAGVYGINGSFSAPANMQYLADFVTALITRYNGDGHKRIKYLEIWNEPAFDGTSAFFVGTATEMAQMAKTVYQAAKAVDPSVIIVAPSDWSSLTKLSSFFTASDGATGQGKDWIEGISLHPYYWYWNTDVYLAQSQLIQSYMAAAKSVLAGVGLSALPIYAGEIGYASVSTDPNLLASTSTELAQWAIRYALGLLISGAKMVLFYAYDTVNSGNPLINPIVSSAWGQIEDYLAGNTLFAIYLDKNNKYKVLTSAGFFTFT